MRVLNGPAVSFFCSLDTGIRHIKEILDIFSHIKLIEVRCERARMEILKSPFENEIL